MDVALQEDELDAECKELFDDIFDNLSQLDIYIIMKKWIF